MKVRTTLPVSLTSRQAPLSATNSNRAFAVGGNADCLNLSRIVVCYFDARDLSARIVVLTVLARVDAFIEFNFDGAAFDDDFSSSIRHVRISF